MANTPDDRCMELIETLHEGEMLSHPLIKHLVDKALTTGNSTALYEYLEKYPVFITTARRNIALATYQQMDNPFRPYPSCEEAEEYLSGPIKAGYINEFNDMFGFHWDILCLPGIIPGRVGSGKSMLLKYILTQILRKAREFNVIIPDLKGEYRDLLTITRYLKVLTSKRIKMNPLLVPSWMTPQEHIVLFSKIFSRENWVGTTSENILEDTVEYLYRARGIFDGSNNYPTLRDLYNLITHRLQKERGYQYRDILLRLQGRLKPYLVCNAFNCRTGIPDDVWRNENIVLEMDSGFTDHTYSFTISYIAGLRFTYNIKKGLIGSVLRTLFIVDEGRILFAVRDVEVYGESYISEIITKIREYGLPFLVASPETASFNQTLKAISNLKVCFPLTDGEEKAAIQKSFGLDDEQANYLFKMPQFGQAIVRYGGYEKPFLLAVPHFNIRKHLTDEEVEERMADFYADLDKRIDHVESPVSPQIIPIMPPDATTLLYNLAKEPFTRISDMTKFTGFKSPGDVNKALNWLQEKGFVIREEYRVSKKGRKSAFAVLTEKAYQYLGVEGRRGKGGFEHSLYQAMIVKRLQSEGIQARIEGKIKGSKKSIDVLAQSNEQGPVAWEVALHLENLIKNIQENIAAGASEVVIVTRDQTDMDKAIKLVSQDPGLTPSLEHITFRTIAEFF
jgi:hypothetical protein